VPIDPDTIRAVDLMQANGHPLRADIIGANHNHFAAVCDLGQILLDAGITQDQWAVVGAGALIVPFNTTCIPEALDINEAVRIQNLYAVSFFRYELLGDGRYAPFLTESDADTDPLVDFFGMLPVVPVTGVFGLVVLGGVLAASGMRRAR